MLAYRLVVMSVLTGRHPAELPVAMSGLHNLAKTGRVPKSSVGVIRYSDKSPSHAHRPGSYTNILKGTISRFEHE